MKPIILSNQIRLEVITSNDSEKLYQLMKSVYPKSYKHLWSDGGDWYVNTLYNRENIQLELAEVNTRYFFVYVKEEAIGILRILHDVVYPKFPTQKATKLHRIYLDPKVHGKGVGKLLMDFTKEVAKDFGSHILWLESMDTQAQSLGFYHKMGFQIGSHVTLSYERLFPALRGMHQMWLAI